MPQISKVRKIAFVGDHLPRNCGIATFTSDLIAVYTCGAMIHHEDLILPYGLADHATGFATVPVWAVLSATQPER